MSSGIWVLVPAAGTGSRMGADRPKQYLSLAGSTVLSHTLTRLSNCHTISGVMVGIASNDSYWPEYQTSIESISGFKGVFTGGLTRAETVLQGCQALIESGRQDDWVLVHDAARPCIRGSDIGNLIDHVQKTGAEGGLLGLPINDTVKRANQAHVVLETIPRAGLWRAQTPQMFRLSQLHSALTLVLKENIEVTDEAQAMEHIGIQALMVEGSADNIKITTPLDLLMAERYLAQQIQEQE